MVLARESKPSESPDDQMILVKEIINPRPQAETPQL